MISNYTVIYINILIFKSCNNQTVIQRNHHNNSQKKSQRTLRTPNLNSLASSNSPPLSWCSDLSTKWYIYFTKSMPRYWSIKLMNFISDSNHTSISILMGNTSTHLVSMMLWIASIINSNKKLSLFLPHKV